MTGVIILAAGASKRLGEAKQNLLFNGKSLLNHAIDVAAKAAVDAVVVVVGAHQKKITGLLENAEIMLVQNEQWNSGMASSIRAGLTYLLDNHSDLENVILMVCDQPYVDENLIEQLIATKTQTNKHIVACSYNNTIGVPVLFNKVLFDELLSLEGEDGGKKILQKHLSSVASISFEKGEVDIDTLEDYRALQQPKNNHKGNLN